jgi:hypothetical protein
MLSLEKEIKSLLTDSQIIGVDKNYFSLMKVLLSVHVDVK